MSSGIDESTGEVVLKFVNGYDEPYTATFELKGVSEVKRKGQVITLSAINGKEENSFEEPEKIYPQESSFSKFDKSFTYEFAPFSYTILRMRIKK